MKSAVINGIAGSFFCPKRLRPIIWRLMGLSVPWRASISPGCIVRGDQLRIGGSTINFRCLFDCRTPVTIGDDCGIAMDVRFLTSGHDWSNPDVRAGEGRSAPIVIGNGVWIGAGATILGGVTIGDGCVIASGAVVNRDCEPHALYGGMPARKLQDLPR